MNEEFLKVGDEITIARAGAEAIENSSAIVKEMGSFGLVVEADRRLVFIRPGVLMFLRVEAQSRNGWAAVEQVESVGELLHLRLTEPRWEDASSRRAPRMLVDRRVIVSFLEPGTKETRRTVGQAINLSRTGVRIRIRAALALKTLVHLQLYLGEQPCVAVASVARVIQGSEAGQGTGFEVGLSFVRFIQGYEEIVAAVGRAEEGSDDGDEFGFLPGALDALESAPAIRPPAA